MPERTDRDVFPESPSAQAGGDGSPAQAFRAALRHVAELRDYATYFLTAKLDGFKLSIRRMVIYAALGAVGLLVATVLVGSAVVLLCWGIAGAFAAWVGHWWLGYLITGALLMLLMGGAIWLGLRRFTQRSRERTVQKYEQWQHQQQAEFGHNVRERATTGQ